MIQVYYENNSDDDFIYKFDGKVSRLYNSLIDEYPQYFQDPNVPVIKRIK